MILLTPLSIQHILWILPFISLNLNNPVITNMYFFMTVDRNEFETFIETTILCIDWDFTWKALIQVSVIFDTFIYVQSVINFLFLSKTSFSETFQSSIYIYILHIYPNYHVGIFLPLIGLLMVSCMDLFLHNFLIFFLTWLFHMQSYFCYS